MAGKPRPRVIDALVKRHSKATEDMTPRMLREAMFPGEYIFDKNATKAAIRIGVPERGAHVEGARLLKRPKVIAKIKELLARREKNTEITAANILNELDRVGRCDVGQAFDENEMPKKLRDMPEDVRRAISKVKVKTWDEGGESGRIIEISFWNKVQGLELLGKHLELFVDRIKVEQPNPHTAHDVETMLIMMVRQLGVAAAVDGFDSVAGTVKQVRFQLDAMEKESGGRPDAIPAEVVEHDQESQNDKQS